MSESKCHQSSQVPKNDGIAQTMPYFGCKVLIDSECKYPPDIAVVTLHVWADSQIVVDVHSREQYCTVESTCVLYTYLEGNLKSQVLR